MASFSEEKDEQLATLAQDNFSLRKISRACSAGDRPRGHGASGGCGGGRAAASGIALLFEAVPLGSNAFKQASMLLALFVGGDGFRVEETDDCLTLGSDGGGGYRQAVGSEMRCKRSARRGAELARLLGEEARQSWTIWWRRSWRGAGATELARCRGSGWSDLDDLVGRMAVRWRGATELDNLIEAEHCVRRGEGTDTGADSVRSIRLATSAASGFSRLPASESTPNLHSSTAAAGRTRKSKRSAAPNRPISEREETSGGMGSVSDSKVDTVSRLAKWRIEGIDLNTSRRSDAFKIGIWNWYLYVEKNKYMYIRLYPEPCRVSKELPVAKFVIRVSIPDPGCRTFISPVNEKLLRSIEDFVWPIEGTIEGHFTIVVEFLDLKASPLAGGEPCSIWPSREILQALSNKSTLLCLSRMLGDGIHTDVTIETSGGDLKAHKAILASSSPVFESMFLHDLKEKQSSTVKIEDMSLESCSALLSCIYGTIKPEDFLKHRPSLLDAANKYDMPKLKDLCEESLLEDINPGNVLERLHEAWLYQLHKLKRACLAYLFDFGKIHDLREEISNFYRQADRELLLEVFQEALIAWKPQ